MKKILPLLIFVAVVGVSCRTCSCPHAHHSHQHQAGCGHPVVLHDGHSDYLHTGHLHHVQGRHVADHRLPANATNPVACTPGHGPREHAANHVHGPGCGHPAIPHGDHVDYFVSGHLHHPHGDHCDNHGPVNLKPN